MGPKLRCDHCEDVIGVYEPIVLVHEGEARESSLASEPTVRSAPGAFYHRACYLEGSTLNNS